MSIRAIRFGPSRREAGVAPLTRELEESALRRTPEEQGRAQGLLAALSPGEGPQQESGTIAHVRDSTHMHMPAQGRENWHNPRAMTGVPVETLRLGYEAGSGPAPGRNRAILRSREPWVFLLDSDAEPAPGCLEELWRRAEEDPDAAVVSPRVLHADEPERVQ